MPDLTDADQKAFIEKVITGLDGNKAELIAKGWDPSQRIANLQAGEESVTNDEKIISPLEVALAQARKTRRTDIDNNYKLASATVSLAEGVLGKNHPFVIALHQIRGGMSQAPAAPAKP